MPLVLKDRRQDRVGLDRSQWNGASWQSLARRPRNARLSNLVIPNFNSPNFSILRRRNRSFHPPHDHCFIIPCLATLVTQIPSKQTI